MGWPTSTAPTSMSTPTRARASIPIGNRTSSTYGRNEVRSFLLSARCSGWTISRRRPARGRGGLDALPGLLPHSRASGFPTSTVATKTWRPSSFLQKFNAACTAASRRANHRGRVHRLAHGLAAHLPGRARDSGSSGTWDGCTTHWSTWRKDPIHRRFHHNKLTFPSSIRSPKTTCCRSRTMRWCTERRAASARCRATSGRSSPTCACSTDISGPAGQEAAVHGRRVRAEARVVPRGRPGVVGPSIPSALRSANLGAGLEPPLPK